MFFTKICLLVIKFSWYVRSKMAGRLCDVDGQAFYGEKSVYEHNKMHLGIKYKCVMCQKTFSTENYLKNSVHGKKNMGRRFFLIIRDLEDEMNTDRRNFKKKNSVRRRLVQ